MLLKNPTNSVFNTETKYRNNETSLSYSTSLNFGSKESELF